jgi:SM-20-related protein
LLALQIVRFNFADGGSLQIVAPQREAMAAAWLSDGVRDPRVLDRARATLRDAKRIHVPNVLRPSAADRLYQTLVATEWRAVFNGAHAAHELSADNFASINPKQREQIVKDVHARAQGDFQFLYDFYHITQNLQTGREPAGVLADFVSMLNAPETLELLRKLTGESRIVSVNAQATRYRPGHFLTQHDDDIQGRDRLFAYVFSFTPVWRADWGGLLLFIGEDGHVQEGYTPAWNALNIFPVGQAHAVSLVAPYAGAFRYSITGWMRGAL